MITAEESTERMVDSMENEHKRQNRLGIRNATYNRKEMKMRKALHPNNESLNTFASKRISSRSLKPTQYLFQPALNYVLKNELGTYKESSRLRSQKWSDRKKQKKEDSEIILDKLQHKQRKLILGLADNFLSNLLLMRSIPNVQYSRGEKERIKIGRVEAMIKQLEYENTLLMEYSKEYN